MTGYSRSYGVHRGERQRKRRMDGRQVLTVCDRCRQSFDVSHIKEEWTGLFVCDEACNGCYEEMHPMLNFQAPIDNSLYRPNPRDLPYDFENAPPTNANILASLRTSQTTNGGTGTT